MAEVVQQSKSHLQDGVGDQEALIQTLDDLLERYLHLLDQYQSLQQKFSQQLSSGFLDLAKANFTNPNRNRYGQDFYDQRMQAATRVTVGSSKPVVSVTSQNVKSTNDKNKPVESESDDSPPSPEEPEGNEKSTNGSQIAQDPIKWFGFLVPPALRSTQASFQSAVIDTIPALVNVNSEMKEVEIEVRRTRKRLSKLG